MTRFNVLPCIRLHASWRLVLFAAITATASAFAAGVDLDRRSPRDGMLALHARNRHETKLGGEYVATAKTVHWKASESAIIICDMWADHPCQMAARRVAEMAPKMNRVVAAARARGVTIIHAPSSGVKFYENTPFRERMKDAPTAQPPTPIQGWCKLDPSKEPPLPIDDSDGGCDDVMPKPKPNFDRHEHPAIKIVGDDGVSDSGVEVYNYFRQKGIKNVVLMGVHTNMCVLGRSFGIRQMVNLEMNVVLCRDLTDTMYDPRDAPFVSHARGTELVVEHIEKHWCPSILSDDLTQAEPGSNTR